MREQIQNVYKAMDKYDTEDVICCGDIFDKWNSPPELINFALKHLPCMWAIPGNHDLPEHSLRDLKRSAYYTLVRAGKIEDLSDGMTRGLDSTITLTGFPYGIGLTPNQTKPAKINIAIIHDYCWDTGHSFPNCPQKKHVTEQAKILKARGFTSATFGDNHKGFLRHYTNMDLLNVGGFLLRKSDEKDRKPQIGLLHSDGSITTEDLPATAKWEDKLMGVEPNARKEIEDLMEVLHGLDSTVIDFREAIVQAIKRKKYDPVVRRILLRSLNDYGR